MSMISTFGNIFKVPELKKKLLFTLFAVAVYRLGAHLPMPGINAQALGLLMQQLKQQGSIFGMYDIFVGGALSRAAILFLGVMPYISSSIIFQLLGSVFPQIERLQRDQAGRRKITQYTRYLTVGLAAFQAISIAIFLETQKYTGPTGVMPIIFNPGWAFRLTAMLTLTCGAVFAMWIGEQITDKGIGNGISFLIFIGCLEEYPGYFIRTVQLVMTQGLSIINLILVILIMVFIVAAVVVMTQAARRIPVQYPKRIVGRKMYGGQSTFLPLRVNTAGVIPIIFAQALVVFPGTVAAYVPALANITQIFRPGFWLYDIVFFSLIVFFTYFYTSVVFNPVELADNMKRYGGFIPGIRPGPRTADYVDNVLSRITLPGALFLGFIALVPWYLINFLNVPFYFGGTTLLIIVGVALDTLQQIESQLMMYHYEGFMKRGRIRGRR
ncbi:preprotein translocase subunit SecY [candidate division WOR_3 bacterium SM23_42]|uniref:Protein translocase subunit SecY n=1 Tax=candidate division WOR_3 bacterium SM23_42 TaxID=1703779 RepID=A0A0S8FUB3_UNCW3|nr:MAG: preprotein translocase subunit SecY [candidate division WOR_3 bacterium SM23_42]